MEFEFLNENVVGLVVRRKSALFAFNALMMLERRHEGHQKKKKEEEFIYHK